MPAISASAPGKIILFGEHAVVYGRPAIAVPVTQVRAKVIVQASPRQAPGQVHIQAPGINLEADLEDLPADHALAAAIWGAAGALNLSSIPPCTLRVTSTIPMAAGLGSGAAVTVALLRALSAFWGHPFSDELVSDLAFQVEKLHHGTPSGIDNTVITYARPVYFVRGQPIEMFSIAIPFWMVIGDTGISSSTAAVVGDVRKAWISDQDHYEALFDSVGAIAESARQALESGSIELLGPLMDANHGLLRKIGVSCPELDELVRAARAAGALGAKLSGGGRGGNMIALTTADRAQQVARALQSSGAVSALIIQVS
jgi:mevalonate kinase